MRKSLIAAFVAVLALMLAGCQNGNDGPATISAEKILSKIKQGKSVCIQGKTVQGKLDFTKSMPANKKMAVSSVYIPVEICFRNCVFEDTVTAFSAGGPSANSRIAVFDRNVVFEECEFDGCLIMSQADFRGRMDFDLSKVMGEADFSGARFRNGCSFCQANFGGSAYFVSCNFGGKAKFFKTLFKSPAVFQHLGFQDAATFADSYFYGSVEFDDILSMSTVDFTNARFIAGASISASRFLSGLRLVSCRFAGGLSLCGNTFAGLLDLRKSQMSMSFEASDNTLMYTPLTAGMQCQDSCQALQQNNRFVQSNIMQLF